MTKMVVQLQSSEVPADSFAAKPKTMFRAGTQFCRVEEAPDPEHGIHGVMITNEPDAWMVNLETKSAQHMVDPGPTFNCHMPIFARLHSDLPEEEARQIGRLEFGFELEFFKSQGATGQPGAFFRASKPPPTNSHLEIQVWRYSHMERRSVRSVWRGSEATSTKSSGTAATAKWTLTPNFLRSLIR
jgi:hypothetical protein